MRWKSKINERPDCHEVDLDYPERYEAWLEKVASEPWMRAMGGMVRWGRVWVGTEAEFFSELEMRVGSGVFASSDFPSDPTRLNDYIDMAFDAFKERGLNFWHLADVPQEDLHHYDAPGWGPGRPILLYAGDAAERPDYLKTLSRFLYHDEHLPLCVAAFTAEDPAFRRDGSWTGKTDDLLQRLIKYGAARIPVPLVDYFRPREERGVYFLPSRRTWDLLNPTTRGDYGAFFRQMDRWAPAFEELGIVVKRRKRAHTVRTTREKVEKRSRTFWTVKGPRWKMRDDFFLGSDVPGRDRTLLVSSWIAAARGRGV